MSNLFKTGERMFNRGYKSGSSFWMDDNYFTKDDFDPFTGEEIVPEKRIDFIKLADHNKIVGNLPYYITSPIIFKILEYLF